MADKPIFAVINAKIERTRAINPKKKGVLTGRSR